MCNEAGEKTITSLEVQTSNSDRISVFLDGDFAFGAHKDVVVEHDLQEGKTLTLDERREIEHDEAYVQAKQQALNYLAHKPRTEAEVRRRLGDQDTPASVVEDVVARLYTLNYLDDESYARDYVRNRFASKKYGPIRLRRELVDRGVDRSVAETTVDDHFADHNPVAAARTHAEKRWGRLADEPDPRRRKQKLYRYLRRRGFTTDTIYTVLDEVGGREAR